MTLSHKLQWRGWDAEHKSYKLQFECDDPKCVGQTAVLTVVSQTIPHKKPEIKGHDSLFHAVIQDVQLETESFMRFEKTFEIKEQTELELSPKQVKGFNYTGRFLEIKTSVQVILNGEILAEVPIQTETEAQVSPKQVLALSDDFTLAYLNKKDKRNLLLSFLLINPRTKFQMITVYVLYFCSLIFSLYFLQDAYYEAHLLDEEEREFTSALIIYVMASVVVIPSLLWWLKGHIYSEKASLKPKSISNRIGQDTQLSPANLFQGRSEVDLKNVTLQVVAKQIETYPYSDSSMMDEEDLPNETLIREELVRAVELYSQTLEHIPRGQAFQSLFKGQLDLKRMFEQLYPPAIFSRETALKLEWEIQLISPQFSDLKVSMKGLKFNESDFFQA